MHLLVYMEVLIYINHVLCWKAKDTQSEESHLLSDQINVQMDTHVRRYQVLPAHEYSHVVHVQRWDQSQLMWLPLVHLSKERRRRRRRRERRRIERRERRERKEKESVSHSAKNYSPKPSS